MGNLPPSVIFRQPPPPRRHLIMANNEEGNTVMVGGNCVSVKYKIRAYYFRRCKRMRPTNIESHLSDDLLFEILVHLPAQDIYDRARLVCWKWYRMIHTHSFIYVHLKCSTYGLLIQSTMLRHPIFVSVRGGRIEISKFSYKFICAVRTGCNGLVLGYDLENDFSYYILNPATKQHFVLPPFFCYITVRRASGIAYAAASMEYKVVQADFIDETQLYILTVGVDNSWRPIYTQHLPRAAKALLLLCPLITEGFMHWAKWSHHVLTLNVETEIVTETPVPLPDQEVDGEETRDKFYMSTGRYLSLLIACGKFSWQVWEMKPESGEWTKLPNIDLEAQKCSRLEHVESLVPVGWLNYPEVLVFRLSTNSQWRASEDHNCAFYNLHTHEIYSIMLPTLETGCCWSTVHRDSLVWLNGS